MFKKKPGGIKKVNQRTLNVLRREVDKMPRISARELKEQNPQLLSHVGVRTIQRILKRDLHYQYRCAWKKPIVTRRQMSNRVAFAKKYRNWPLDKIKKVLWSDEVIFNVTHSRAGRIRRRPGSDALDPKFLCGTVKHPEKIMVWGCFSYYGLMEELVILPKNQMVNKESYLDLIASHLFDCFDQCNIPFSTGTFMHDGATPHTAKIVKDWFDWVNIEYFKTWPGNSPDLNPIENLWSVMKARLQGRDTSSIIKLTREVKAIWADIQNKDQEIYQNLALSVPDRLEEVIRRSGRPTKY